MIHLPTPYTDELFFSVLARYGRQAGSELPTIWLKRLFETGSRLHADFGVTMTKIAGKLTGAWRPSADELILNHTPFPYYTIFRKPSERAALLNSEKRITGNALIEIVDAVLEHRRTGLPLEQVQKVVDRLVLEHAQLPEATVSRPYRDWRGTPAVRVDLYSQLLSIVRENSETI